MLGAGVGAGGVPARVGMGSCAPGPWGCDFAASPRLLPALPASLTSTPLCAPRQPFARVRAWSLEPGTWSAPQFSPKWEEILEAIVMRSCLLETQAQRIPEVGWLRPITLGGSPGHIHSPPSPPVIWGRRSPAWGLSLAACLQRLVSDKGRNPRETFRGSLRFTHYGLINSLSWKRLGRFLARIHPLV